MQQHAAVHFCADVRSTDDGIAFEGGDYIAPSFMTHNVDGLPNGTWHGESTDAYFRIYGSAFML